MSPWLIAALVIGSFLLGFLAGGADREFKE